MRVKNKNRYNIATFLKNLSLVFLLSLALSFSPLGARESHAWLSFSAAQYKQMLEEISYRTKGIILGALKQQAAQVLNKQVSQMVGGGSGNGPMFITDWRDYLVKKPQDRTNQYMNDYLSKITSGRGSYSNYIPNEGFRGVGGTGGTGGTSSAYLCQKNCSGNSACLSQCASASSSLSSSGGSYASRLVADAKSSTTERKDPQFNYPGDPSQMFAQGNFKMMDLYLSGINNPWAFNMNAQAEYQKRLAEEKKISEAKSQAYLGFIGKGEKPDGSGIIRTPGSVVKDTYTNQQDLGNKIIASATHPEEVITALVTQMITQTLQQGIGQVNAMIDQQVGNMMNQLNEAMAPTSETNCPGSQYQTTTGNSVLDYLKSKGY